MDTCLHVVDVDDEGDGEDDMKIMTLNIYFEVGVDTCRCLPL